MADIAWIGGTPPYDTTLTAYKNHGAIGTGRKNTALILAQDANAPAAKACNNMNSGGGTGGQTDWFLPSVEELNQLYINRSYVGNLTTNYYWSSSQSDNDLAWLQYFYYGSQFSYVKLNPGCVRAVRAF